MANVHYAKIGDVWKHLPLAEVLGIGRPGRYYWESHAGSSTYPLTRSPERDYGVFLFLERAGSSSALKGSAYRRLLYLRESSRTPPTYPGSPLIAMELLGDAAEFVFCDLDGASLANIEEDARASGVPSDRVRLVQGDGVSAVVDELAALSEEEASATFLHVDPYHPLEP
jgi:23S rRNA (adenine2030-N6)-methyltransferase